MPDVQFNLTAYTLLAFCVKRQIWELAHKLGVPHKSRWRWGFLAGLFLLALSLVPPHFGHLPVIFGMQKLALSFAFSIKHLGTDKRSTHSSELGAYVNVGSSYPFLEFFLPDSKCLPWGTYFCFTLIIDKVPCRKSELSGTTYSLNMFIEMLCVFLESGNDSPYLRSAGCLLYTAWTASL